MIVATSAGDVDPVHGEFVGKVGLWVAQEWKRRLRPLSIKVVSGSEEPSGMLRCPSTLNGLRDT